MAAKVIGFKYTVKNGKGEVVDSNLEGQPLKFITGKSQIIPGLEKELEKMEVGEKKVIKVKPEEAYGQYNPQLVEELPREQFEGIELQKGMQLYGQTPDGQVIMVTVKDFNDKTVTIDYNHPLAGEELTFEVEITSKRDATPTEEMTGEVEDKHHCGCGSCSC
jgi:FKBP-type peptidyl-prolyl cis-trans isomerase SlyD